MTLEVEVEKFKRQALTDILAKLTTEQVAFFDRLFPGGVVPEKELNAAYDLCERTLNKNLEGR